MVDVCEYVYVMFHIYEYLSYLTRKQLLQRIYKYIHMFSKEKITNITSPQCLMYSHNHNHTQITKIDIRNKETRNGFSKKK